MGARISVRAVLIGVLVSLIGTPPSAQTPAADALPDPRAIDVDGLAMRVRTGGLEGRRAGQPAIVLESGATAALEHWDSIFAAASRLAPTIAYDRSGTGQTPWDRQLPTPDRIAERLHRLLARAGVPPPYVLVGHSWGGALIRYYAARYPAEIAGLVHIDPLDPALTHTGMIELFTSFGASAEGYGAFRKVMEAGVASLPEAVLAENTVVNSLLEGKAGPLPQPPAVPSSVILAGRLPRFPPKPVLPFDTKAYAEAMQARRVKVLPAWVTGGGRFMVAENAGHSVHVDAPQLVIAEIERLIGMKR